MSSIPEWPDAPGPRILTLVGNDITIDVRARKTASSLARAGFSVISMGIDAGGNAPRTETLDGALLWRVQPSANPMISPRRLRISRPELRDWFWFHAEARRQRLFLRRRNSTAKRYAVTLSDPRSVTVAGDLFAKALRALRIRSADRNRLRSGFDRRTGQLVRESTSRLERLSLIADQKTTGAFQAVYRWLARPSTHSPRKGDWRRDLPELHRWEAALGGIVDALSPDLIHAHDVFHIGLASRAKARAILQGQTTRVVYDAHEYIPGLPAEPRKRLAYSDLESEYIHQVDSVVTVAPEMAQAIVDRHGITPPSVVMNAPDMDTIVEVPNIRSVCAIPLDSPLLVYVGGIAPHRGAELMLAALQRIEGAHLVLVVGPLTSYVRSLLDSADARGLAGRVHTAPFVAPESVVSYLRGTDVTLIPLSREVDNYEVTLPNKLFQSIQAGVPVVVSDNPAMARFVKEHHVGEVFIGGDELSLAAAVEGVLAEPDHYREALADTNLLGSTTWTAQVRALLEVYSELGIRPE